MSDLASFLLERVAEDEAAARGGVGAPDLIPIGCLDPERVLAECEVKRRIVEDYQHLNADYRVTRAAETGARRFQAAVAMGHLATAYSDHPDYDETWRP